MKIVVIEWDGKQPPTTYYNGLHRLHLRVRGDKKTEPIVRRARKEDHSVIVQEGSVLVESESLARQVAYLAKNNGARTVFIGDCDMVEDSRSRNLSDAEIEVINRFNKAFRQRGRPAESDRIEREWVVSCPECVHTSTVTSEKAVIQCPNCGGLRVAARLGYKHIFSHTPRSMEEWKDMYFVEGYFETPDFNPSIKGEAVEEVTLEGDNLAIYEILSKSEVVLNRLVPKIGDFIYRSLINDIFMARRYVAPKERQRARTRMVVDLLQRGVNPAQVPLIEKQNEYDVLDGSAILEEESLIRNFYLQLI